ncbi:MAG: 50S ribosomal protein L11 methyltransferase [Vicinamibacterales bacterium]
MSLIIDEHREYLSDAPRLSAFRRALAEVIRPGDVVLDLASGTGILGYLACQAGAGRVYAIDDGSIVGIARELARANGLSDRVHVIRDISTWATLPERVDVIVTDQIGHLGFDAGLVQYVADARRRMLKPGGRIIPGAIAIHVAPCHHDPVRDAVEFWTRPVAGLDVSAVRPMASCTGYPYQLAASQLLAPAQPIVRIDLSVAEGEMLEGEATFAIEAPGTFDGIAGWFVAELAPGVTMTNGPGHPDRINRRQSVLPVDRRMSLEAGDRVAVGLRVRPTETVLDWRVTVSAPDGTERARFRHSTFAGMLFSVEDLARTEPGRVPALSPVGRARRSVLELCDGQRTIGEIEREVRERHRDLLPTDAAAAMFVAEVLTRYAE